MKNYYHFSVEDFVRDEFFQSWVLRPDERSEAFWQQWLAEYPEKVAEIEEARHVLQQVDFPQFVLSQEEVTALWNRIRHADYQPAPIYRTAAANRVWYLVAASLVLLALVIPLRLWLADDWKEYQTAFGETRTIVLPDSSTVILNANSRLSYDDKTWSNASAAREIWLSGEAYFDVTHKVNNQPFRVKVDGGVSVEVLGTTFNVSHRTEATRVVLNSGQIRLSLPDDKVKEKIVMKPGELVEYANNIVQKRSVDPSVFVAWTQQKLVLDHTSLREMVQMLENNYGLDVQVEPEELLEQTVSGSMPITDGLSLADQIGRAFRLKIEHDGNTILITE